MNTPNEFEAASLTPIFHADGSITLQHDAALRPSYRVPVAILYAAIISGFVAGFVCSLPLWR